MQAVVLTEPRHLTVRPDDAPPPGPGDARVRLRLGGICGSDLSAYRGTSPMVTYPRVLGHELLVDVLPGADAGALGGRRAVVEPLLPCGACVACRHGRYNCCERLRVLGVHTDGGLRGQWSVPAAQLRAVPEALPDQVAVLAEPLSIAYHAVERSGIEAGQVALVFGAGTIGLLIAQLLVRARGCRALVVDSDPWRREVAGALGASPVAAEPESVLEAVGRATDGELAAVAFEATGAAACTLQTTAATRHGGRVVLVGWNRGPVTFDTVAVMRKELDVLGSRNSRAAFGPVLRLLADGTVDAERMITHRFALTRAPEALELLDRGAPGVLKVLLGPGGA